MTTENAGRSRAREGQGVPGPERVAEAMALLRSRRAAQKASRKPKNDMKSDSVRSPLVPTGQNSGCAQKKREQKISNVQQSSFLSHVFASRSDIDTTPRAQEYINSSPSNESAENAQQRQPTFFNPLELVKREMLLATQSSVSRNKDSARKTGLSVSTKLPVSYSIRSLSSDDSSESGVPVDDQTLKDVAQYLDKLSMTGVPSHNGLDRDNDGDSLNSSTIVVGIEAERKIEKLLNQFNEKSASMREDNGSLSALGSTTDVSSKVDSMKSTVNSDNTCASRTVDHLNDDASVDTEDSIGSAVDPERLAQIGAFIDNVSRSGKLSRYQEEETSDCGVSHQSISKRSSNTSLLKNLKTKAQPQWSDEANESAHTEDNGGDGDSPEDIFDDIIGCRSSESTDIVAQTRVSKPSPIYEQLEAKTLPRNARVDPPAMITSRNEMQVDPPAPSPKTSMHDHIMQMHQSEIMAPSYSVESLESGGIIPLLQIDSHELKVETDECDNTAQRNQDVVSLQHFGPLSPASQSQAEFSIGNDFGENADNSVRNHVVDDESLVDGRYDAVKSKASKDSAANANKDVVPDLPDVLPDELRLQQLEALSPSSQSHAEMSIGNDFGEKADNSVRDHAVDDEFLVDGRYDVVESKASNDSVASGGEDVVPDLPDVLPDELRLQQFEALSPSSQSHAEISIDNDFGENTGIPLRAHAVDDKFLVDGRYDVVESKASNGSVASGGEDVVPNLPEVLPDLPNSPSLRNNEAIGESNSNHKTIKVTGLTYTLHTDNSSALEDDETDCFLDHTKETHQSDQDEDDMIEAFFNLGSLQTSTADSEAVHVQESSFKALNACSTDGVDEIKEIENENDDVLNNASTDTKKVSVDATPNHDCSSPIFNSNLVSQNTEPSTIENEEMINALLNSRSSSCSVDFNSEEYTVPTNSEGILGKYKSITSSVAREDDSEEIHGFLEQFESLEMDADDDGDETTDKEVIAVSVNGKAEEEQEMSQCDTVDADMLLPSEIAHYFASLNESKEATSETMIRNIGFFQQLVDPIMSGEKPTIIEAAQIRQAALRARVRMDLVDRFLDFANNDDSPPVLAVLSSRSDPASFTYDNIEEINEDEAITAFLTRFGTLHEGSHFPNGDVTAIQNIVGASTGVHEEAVEVDADFGFVNKDLAEETLKDDDDDSEWWKDGQKNLSMIGMNHPTEDFMTDQNKREYTEAALEAAGKPEARNSDPSPLKDRLKVSMSYLVLNKDHDDEWSRRNEMATYGRGWLSPRGVSKPSRIDGVAASRCLHRFVSSKRIFKNFRPWKQLYKERTRHHPGFKHVDIHSIYESTKIDIDPPLEETYIPWEHREVQQRFLHETSFGFSRNWFGALPKRNGNIKIKTPVCKPKSMEMPMEMVPEPGEWTAEWFTQWKYPYQRQMSNQSNTDEESYLQGSTRGGQTTSDQETFSLYTTDRGSNTSFTDGSNTRHYNTDYGSYTDGSTLRQSTTESVIENQTTDQGSFTDGYTTQRYTTDQGSYTGRSYTSESTSDSDAFSLSDNTESWEEAPECGEIINIKQRIGERVTRVHPDYTSSLRRSRFRKKYYPRGTFPYK